LLCYVPGIVLLVFEDELGVEKNVFVVCDEQLLLSTCRWLVVV
jgi:hypothetical protein